MKSKLRLYTALSLVIAGLLLVAPASPGSSMALQTASLTLSPRIYVGGQNVTLAGNIGLTGVRRIHLQSRRDKPGGVWGDVRGFQAQTAADGSFRFTHPAWSMFGLSMRVVSGSAATPSVTFNAKSQDLVLEVDSGDPGLDPGQVHANRNFSILVDTTPTELRRRPDLPPPAFPGRTLTLQQRVGLQHQADLSRWEDLATTQTDQAGEGRFQLTAGVSDMVIRVREEDWTKDGDRIGWFPSFPTYVDVVPSGAAVTAPSSGTLAPREAQINERGTDGGGARTGTTAARSSTWPTASERYGWRPALWDFGWEFGESLTNLPYRGTDPRGWWLDSSDGSGRASKHNGGLMLDSQRGVDGAGDFGSTAATIQGNPMTYGRWETKLRLKSPEQNASDYHVKFELVPARAADYHCGGQNITVADLTPHGSTVTVGAKAFRAGRQWTSRSPIGSLLGPSATFSVEVARGHISWFLNGRVIATVRDRAAVSDVPMTLRFSLVGKGQQEMNRTQAISDWQRGFSLDRGQRVTSGKVPQRGTYTGGC